MTAPSAAMVERMSILLLLLALVAKAVPLPLLNIRQPQNDFLDTSAEYYNDEDFSPLYLNTDIDLLKRDLEIPYELDLPEELLEDEELPRTFRKTIALLQAFNDLEKRDTEKEMVVDVPPSLAYRFELPRTDRKKTTTMQPPVTPTKLSEEKRGQPEQVVLLENHNDPKFGNTP